VASTLRYNINAEVPNHSTTDTVGSVVNGIRGRMIWHARPSALFSERIRLANLEHP
jgi:hypothetical protein